MRLDWTDLQLFVHACDSGSLTGAAQRAHLTLAAVSARMRQMEDECGTALLTRHARGVRPTAAGEALREHARAVLDRMAQLRGALAHHRRAPASTVHLLANSSAVAQWLARPLAAFLRLHPQCVVQVTESTSHLSVQALRDGLADAAIVSDAVDTAGLECHALGPDPLVLLLPRGHALGRLRRVGFAQAVDAEWIGHGEGSALQAHLALQASRLGRPLRQRASLGRFGAVAALVAAGTGIAVLPSGLAARFARDDRRLLVRPLAEPWARRTLLMALAPGQARQPLLTALRSCFDAG